MIRHSYVNENTQISIASASFCFRAFMYRLSLYLLLSKDWRYASEGNNSTDLVFSCFTMVFAAN